MGEAGGQLAKGDKRTGETDRADNNREKKISAVRRLEELIRKIETEALSGNLTIEISSHNGTLTRVFHGYRAAE